jgi:diguanylate cyclase (GGDEF)-like protein
MKTSVKLFLRRMAIGSWDYLWQAAVSLYVCVSFFTLIVGLFTYLFLCVYHQFAPVMAWQNMSMLQQSIIGSLLFMTTIFSLLLTTVFVKIYDNIIYRPVKYLLGEVNHSCGEEETHCKIEYYLRGGKMSPFDLHNPRKSWIERVQEHINSVSKEKYFDEITGCFNRKYFSQVLTEILKTHVLCSLSQNLMPKTTSNIEYGMYLIDIDHFKNINDEFGHMYGDEVLRQVGLILRTLIGTEGVVVRNGGEEFLIIVCNKYPMNYPLIAEKIRKEFSESVYVTYQKTQEVRPITCSVGYVPFPLFDAGQTCISVEQHVDMADQAMYLAKGGGRNTWRGIHPLSPPSHQEEFERSAASVSYGEDSGYFRIVKPNALEQLL